MYPTRETLLQPERLGIAGVDEAGRGPLAGPVVAAAVELPLDFCCDGLDDSKRLTASQREREFERIQAGARWAIAVVDSETIDAINILQATYRAMRRALADLGAINLALIDGDRIPPDLGCPAEAWVKGDSRHASIAAASILAKVTRDRLMTDYAERYPHYGFEKHKGYGAPEHLAAIAQFGPCPIHRRSFAPIRQDDQLCLTFGP